MNQSDKEIHINSFLGENPGFLMPEGRISKNATGIGATQSEIVAQRDSIIVFPSKSIAFTKHLKHKITQNTFYVGSCPDKTTVVKRIQILQYHKTQKQPKKILCVANSLHKVFEAIGEDEVYNTYFLMFDEIDKFQNESTFRSELECCIDYYLDPRCHGCLVSASLDEFSNEELQKQPLTTIIREGKCRQPIGTMFLDSKDDGTVAYYVFQRISESLQNGQKIVFAHKSVKRIKSIIEELPHSIREEIGVLGGSECEEQLKKYYTEINTPGFLPANIIFMTSAYFAGFDIDEKCHLVIISDRSTNFSLLTMDEVIQVCGRFRNGLISAEILLPKSEYKPTKITRRMLLKSARTVLPGINAIIKQCHSANIDSNVKDRVIDLMLNLTRNQVALVRLNAKKDLTISTFTIDQYVNRNKNLADFYRGGTLTIKALKNKGFEITSVSELPCQTIPEDVVLDDVLKNWLIIRKTDYEPHGEVEKRARGRILKIDNLICEKDVPLFIKDTWTQRDQGFHDEIVKHITLALPVHFSYPRLLGKSIEIGHFYTSKDIQKVMMDVRQTIRGKPCQELTTQKCLKYLGYLFDWRYTSKRINHQTVNGYMIRGKIKSKYKLIPVTEPFAFPEDLA